MNKIRKDIKKKFSKLDFDKVAHSYKLKERGLSSVSSLIKEYCEPFDSDKISYFIAKKRGITQQEVIAEWDELKNIAITKGNKTHDFGESYEHGVSQPETPHEYALCRFWSELPEELEHLLNELKMYSEEYLFAGTTDAIFLNTKTNKLVIVDYKTNKDLFKNYKKKLMLEPFGFLLDCPYNKYQLQLSFYQILLEEIGYEVESRIIVWLLPDGSYLTYNTEDLTELIRKEIKRRNNANW